MSKQSDLLNLDYKGIPSLRGGDFGHRPPKKKALLITATALITLSSIVFFATHPSTPDLAVSTPQVTPPAQAEQTSSHRQTITLKPRYSLTPITVADLPIATEKSRTPIVAAEPIAQAPTIIRNVVTVGNGDSLLTLFERAGVNVSTWYAIRNINDDIKRLTQLRPGEQLEVERLETGQLLNLTYSYGQEHSLIVSRDSNGTFSTEIIYNPIEREIVSISGQIENSFFLSAQRAGLEDNQIMSLAELFAWDINFALDVRRGDRFSVIYEKLIQDGKFLGYGSIVAAEFYNRNRRLRTVRFTNDNNEHQYYTPEGRSMRRAFLQSPVHFTRISSRFDPSRVHPIFKTTRPHRGVDYAAPKGTKIMAAGDGIVEFIGKQRGYGQTIILKHGQHYTTLYAHMSKFARLQKGSRVKQGDTIGYVGRTGAATGDHLHYEFRVDGVHKNPLTVKLPAAAPIASKYVAEFENQSQPLLSWLDSLSAQTHRMATRSNDPVAAPAP